MALSFIINSLQSIQCTSCHSPIIRSIKQANTNTRYIALSALTAKYPKFSGHFYSSTLAAANHIILNKSAAMTQSLRLTVAATALF